MNVTKKNIAFKLSESLSVDKNISLNFTNSFFLNIKKSIQKNDQTKIKNFGNFSKVYTKERTGRNPETKEPYIIRSRQRVKFSSSSFIKKFLN